MHVNVETEIQHSLKGIGPYLVITLTLDHREVPAADHINVWAEKAIDEIWGKYTSIPGAIKAILTKIYGKLTPEIRKNDAGYGVIVVTHVPAGGIGVPYSTVTARKAESVGVGEGGGGGGGGKHVEDPRYTKMK